MAMAADIIELFDCFKMETVVYHHELIFATLGEGKGAASGSRMPLSSYFSSPFSFFLCHFRLAVVFFSIFLSFMINLNEIFR